MAKYTIIGIARGVEKRWTRDKAPGTAVMARWALNHQLTFMTRYYPAKKAWLLLDCRNVFELQTVTGRTYATGHRLGAFRYPNADAALMAATHLAFTQDNLL